MKDTMVQRLLAYNITFAQIEQYIRNRQSVELFDVHCALDRTLAAAVTARPDGGSKQHHETSQ